MTAETETKTGWSRLTREETDRQYNPTLWTGRMAADELLPAHVAFTTRESESYRSADGTRLRTIVFGEGEMRGETDVWSAENVADEAPIVFYVHGGWWQWFGKEQFSYLAAPFNREGMTVHMPGYRMAGDWENGRPMESILEQMEYALAATLREACERRVPAVYLVGHSAGGQLVAMLRGIDAGKHDLPVGAAAKLKGVFSLAGLFDLRYLLDSFVNDAIGMTLESAESVSPQLLRGTGDDGLCPIHLILPEYDTAEFFRQTKEYHQKLIEEGQPCHLKVLAGRDHLDVIERLVGPGDELFAYMMSHMGGGGTDDGRLIAAVREASAQWKAAFNAGDARGCAAQYEAQATMRAEPFGTFEGRDEIESFWQKIIDDGYAEVEYLEPKLEVVDASSVLLKSGWRMNKASGVIHRELWVIQEDGSAKLREDHFEVTGE